MNKNNTFSLKRLIVVLIIIVIAVGIYWVRHARTKDSPAPIRTDTANITASQSRTQDEPRPASPTSHSVTLSKKAQQLKDAQWAQQIANDPAVLAEERDNQRIAETRTVSEALAAYHANGDYPKNLIELTTSSGSTFTVPIAPTPADGSCTTAQNTYTYTRISKDSFTLGFCLGKNWANLKQGPHIWTEKGIQ